MAKPITPKFIPWSELDFWNDPVVVQAMNWMQRHLYRALLLKAHVCATRPYLPDDDNQLWLLADAGSLKNWTDNKEPILQKFTREVIDGKPMLAHKRVLSDWANTIEYYEGKREAARQGGLARAKHMAANAEQPLSKPCLTDTDTDSVKGNKQSQLVTESVGSGAKAESASFLDGSQSQPQNKPQPAESAPPSQPLSGDRYALAIDILRREEPGQENPIVWANRMVAMWHAIRLEKNYSSTYPEEVNGQDFQKLISETWLAKAGFREPISRAEIQLCIQWALRTSTHWGKRNILLGSAGFVNAFGAIKKQCFNYHSSKEMRNREIGKKEESAHPRISLKAQPPVTVVQPNLPDNTMKSVLQEIRDMRTDSASAPFGSTKWKGLRWRELTESGECSPSAAEIQIEHELKQHEENQAAIRDAVKEKGGPLDAKTISTMLAANKVMPEEEEQFERELSDVSDL
jgi:hypothetical protein